MNDFARGLPWRIATIAGLLVGSVSAAGGADFWACLLRGGVAFGLFGVLGQGLRAILEKGQAPAGRPPGRGPNDHRGKHLDQSLPEMHVQDLATPAEQPSSSRADETRR